MEQIEVTSWKSLDALKNASQILESFGDLDTNEQMAVFCSIEEDYFELYYSELESNYVRRFDDEEELLKFQEIRKTEFGEDDFVSSDFYDEDGEYDDTEEDEYEDFSIREEGDSDDF